MAWQVVWELARQVIDGLPRLQPMRALYRELGTIFTGHFAHRGEQLMQLADAIDHHVAASRPGDAQLCAGLRAVTLWLREVAGQWPSPSPAGDNLAGHAQQTPMPVWLATLLAATRQWLTQPAVLALFEPSTRAAIHQVMIPAEAWLSQLELLQAMPHGEAGSAPWTTQWSAQWISYLDMLGGQRMLPETVRELLALAHRLATVEGVRPYPVSQSTGVQLAWLMDVIADETVLARAEPLLGAESGACLRQILAAGRQARQFPADAGLSTQARWLFDSLRRIPGLAHTPAGRFVTGLQDALGGDAVSIALFGKLMKLADPTVSRQALAWEIGQDLAPALGRAASAMGWTYAREQLPSWAEPVISGAYHFYQSISPDEPWPQVARRLAGAVAAALPGYLLAQMPDVAPAGQTVQTVRHASAIACHTSWEETVGYLVQQARTCDPQYQVLYGQYLNVSLGWQVYRALRCGTRAEVEAGLRQVSQVLRRMDVLAGFAYLDRLIDLIPLMPVLADAGQLMRQTMRQPGAHDSWTGWAEALLEQVSLEGTAVPEALRVALSGQLAQWLAQALMSGIRALGEAWPPQAAAVAPAAAPRASVSVTRRLLWTHGGDSDSDSGSRGADASAGGDVSAAVGATETATGGWGLGVEAAPRPDPARSHMTPRQGQVRLDAFGGADPAAVSGAVDHVRPAIPDAGENREAGARNGKHEQDENAPVRTWPAFVAWHRGGDRDGAPWRGSVRTGATVWATLGVLATLAATWRAYGASQNDGASQEEGALAQPDQPDQSDPTGQPLLQDGVRAASPYQPTTVALPAHGSHPGPHPGTPGGLLQRYRWPLAAAALGVAVPATLLLYLSLSESAETGLSGSQVDAIVRGMARYESLAGALTESLTGSLPRRARRSAAMEGAPGDVMARLLAPLPAPARAQVADALHTAIAMLGTAHQFAYARYPSDAELLMMLDQGVMSLLEHASVGSLDTSATALGRLLLVIRGQLGASGDDPEINAYLRDAPLLIDNEGVAELTSITLNELVAQYSRAFPFPLDFQALGRASLGRELRRVNSRHRADDVREVRVYRIRTLNEYDARADTARVPERTLRVSLLKLAMGELHRRFGNQYYLEVQVDAPAAGLFAMTKYTASAFAVASTIERDIEQAIEAHDTGASRQAKTQIMQGAMKRAAWHALEQIQAGASQPHAQACVSALTGYLAGAQQAAVLRFMKRKRGGTGTAVGQLLSRLMHPRYDPTGFEVANVFALAVNGQGQGQGHGLWLLLSLRDDSWLLLDNSRASSDEETAALRKWLLAHLTVAERLRWSGGAQARDAGAGHAPGRPKRSAGGQVLEALIDWIAEPTSMSGPVGGEVIQALFSSSVDDFSIGESYSPYEFVRQADPVLAQTLVELFIDELEENADTALYSQTESWLAFYQSDLALAVTLAQAALGAAAGVGGLSGAARIPVLLGSVTLNAADAAADVWRASQAVDDPAERAGALTDAIFGALLGAAGDAYDAARVVNALRRQQATARSAARLWAQPGGARRTGVSGDDLLPVPARAGEQVAPVPGAPSEAGTFRARPRKPDPDSYASEAQYNDAIRQYERQLQGWRDQGEYLPALSELRYSDEAGQMKVIRQQTYSLDDAPDVERSLSIGYLDVKDTRLVAGYETGTLPAHSPVHNLIVSAHGQYLPGMETFAVPEGYRVLNAVPFGMIFEAPGIRTLARNLSDFRAHSVVSTTEVGGYRFNRWKKDTSVSQISHTMQDSAFDALGLWEAGSGLGVKMRQHQFARFPDDTTARVARAIRENREAGGMAADILVIRPGVEGWVNQTDLFDAIGRVNRARTTQYSNIHVMACRNVAFDSDAELRVFLQDHLGMSGGALERVARDDLLPQLQAYNARGNNQALPPDVNTGRRDQRTPHARSRRADAVPGLSPGTKRVLQLITVSWYDPVRKKSTRTERVLGCLVGHDVVWLESGADTLVVMQGAGGAATQS
ncbi:hypothetical protein [Paraburkholderia aspalathi]|uniref:hypothetical protein n=1 Tax=Paraburkholderia aspalathi TaxID=1324617 RepID=UPI0038BB630E